MKRLMTLLLSALLLLGLVACGQGEAAKDTGPHRLKVVATVFPAYDFARAAGGEWVEVTMLLPPGAESHSYEPTPADILAAATPSGRHTAPQLSFPPASPKMLADSPR